MKRLFIIVLALISLANAQVKSLPLLKISSNKRFFETSDNKPFFWLGDTGWLLFAKTTKEQAVHYLQTRMEQGFNVVQVMVLHELKEKNAYGDSALVRADVSIPLIDEKKYDYWDHIDYIIGEAEKRGIYMALVPVWGSNVKSGHVSVKQAEQYAKFLALRYKNRNNIIWINGGDVKGTDGLDVWKAIGSNIKKYDPRHLQTYHPRGRNSSSKWFHNESWLDFNMFQSGHRNYAQDTSSNEKLHYGEDNWRYVNDDYKLTPTKPTMDGEPSYENIPQGLHDYTQPLWTADDVRRYAYWDVFGGGAGFTYGENSVMQFHTVGDSDANYNVKKNWEEAINAPGANQMKYLKELILSKSYLDRVPDQTMILNSGRRYNYILATRGTDYALIYTYTGRKIKVQLGKFPAESVRAVWFDPRTGTKIDMGTFDNKGTKDFDPPGESKPGNDWVLILEKV